jgi:hypothetical protein
MSIENVAIQARQCFSVLVLLFYIALLTIQVLKTLPWKSNKEFCVSVFVQH